MIDAQAVVSRLQTLRSNAPDHAAAEDAFLAQELQGLAVEQVRDAAGHYRVTLPGASKRAVVLGIGPSAGDGLKRHVPAVIVFETLRALARKLGPQPPCSVQVVVWSGGTETPEFAEDASAYLEMFLADGDEQGSVALGVVEATEFHPRLTALCDEAVQELTGTSGAVRVGPDASTSRMLAAGVPAAMMYVALPAVLPADALPEAARLHILQAAEAFGRWAEATVHLVAGDEVDLWAQEHRVPRL